MSVPSQTCQPLLTSRAELTRDILHGETSATRSRALRPLGTGSFDSKQAEVAGGLALIAEYDVPRLDDYIPPLPLDMLDSNERRTKDKEDYDRLATDLNLACYVYHSTPLTLPPTTVPRDTQTTSLDTPEDLFARVSLNDNEPPPITFSYFHQDRQNSNPAILSKPADPSSMSARHLLSEWQLGADPGTYNWKAWLDPATSAPELPPRPIRPLPSTRSPLRPAFAKAPPIVQTSFQPVRARTELRPAESMPTSFKLPPAVARSSPPPMPQSSQDFGFAQTQVEPGKFGGRAGGTKKKVKKRVGGF